jgi:LPS-assembly protein
MFTRFLTFSIIGLSIISASAHAQNITRTTEEPILLSADSITYNREPGIVTASGSVELVSGDRILQADSVSYDQRKDLVAARGNVTILEPSGEVLFAEYTELTDRLKNGFASKIRMLMTDESRFAANSARRADGNRTDMSRAVFSACQSCPKNPNRPPLWQIKAFNITHIQSVHRIDYRDAFLEVYGIPVAYMPFFSHPDPTVERKSGFLVPTYGSSSELGAKLQVPYYFNLAPNRDATFSPLFTSKEGIVLAGEYRERTDNGDLQIKGSVTRVDERNENSAKTGSKENRGHIESTGAFDINSIWRWGFVAERSTDDTYLRRYDFSGEDTLTSNVYLEGFRGRTYASANSYSFQGLRSKDNPGETPLIFPELNYNFVGEPGRLGQRWGIDANALVLNRSGSTDSRRTSLGVSWQLPYTSENGQLYNLLATLRGDLYHVNEVTDPSNADNTISGFKGRLLPRIVIDWRYPHVRRNGSISHVIEPVMAVIAAPFGGNPQEIPNEDSQSFEFDDTNLFSSNRFSGLDRWEGGHRVNYGIRYGAYGSGGSYSTALIGQSLRWRGDNTFADRTGLEDRRSDYVGRLNISPGDYLTYAHRFRLDRDRFSLRRNEFDLALGPRAIRINAGYVALSRELTTDELSSREEVRLSGRVQITNFWSASASTRRDLAGEGDTIAWSLRAGYADECIEFGIQLERNFTEDRDIQPSTNFSLRIKLKHLG